MFVQRYEKFANKPYICDMERVRIDKYLWSVRLYKTRSDAAEALRSNKVLVNGAYTKPSRDVSIGDKMVIRKGVVSYTYEVLDLVSNRQPAKNVPIYIRDMTPESELEKLNMPRETVFVTRDRGTGRPTKRDRREIEGVMAQLTFDDDLIDD